MPPIYILLRLIYVICSIFKNTLLQGPHNIPPSEIINNSRHFNFWLLRYVETIMTQNGRMDIIDLVQQTMSGDYSLLQDFENLVQFRTQFQDNPRPRREWPRLHFQYTTNNCPVRQETCFIQGEQDEQNNERCRVELANEPVMPQPTAQLGHCPPHERRPRGTSPRPGRNSSQPSQGNHVAAKVRKVRRTNGPEPNLAARSMPPLVSVRCRNCEKDLNVIKTSSDIWRRIDDIMKRLNPQQVHKFIEEVKNYDYSIFNSVQFQNATPLDIVPHIIDALRRCKLQGGKCVLCLLVYMFQRIGRSDLANEIKEIPEM